MTTLPGGPKTRPYEVGRGSGGFAPSASVVAGFIPASAGGVGDAPLKIRGVRGVMTFLPGGYKTRPYIRVVKAAPDALKLRRARGVMTFLPGGHKTRPYVRAEIPNPERQAPRRAFPSDGQAQGLPYATTTRAGTRPAPKLGWSRRHQTPYVTARTRPWSLPGKH